MAIRDRFFIGPINDGLQKNVKAWLINDDAFAQLNNAYVFRGRIKKRVGSRLLNENVSSTFDAPSLSSKLRILVGSTDASGDLSGTVPGIKRKVGQQFSIGNEVFTVNSLGTPANMLSTGTAVTKTFDTGNGNFVFTGATASNPVYFYPAEPVMAIPNMDSSLINFEDTLAFDTQFAYQFTLGFWNRLDTGLLTVATWTGTDSNFFWWENYRGITKDQTFLFVVNFVAADGLRYWDGTNWVQVVMLTNDAGDTIETARIVISFKDRLLLLNTIQKVSGSSKNFVNRCYYSKNGPAVAVDSWDSTDDGPAGFEDATTKEQIISAQIIRDRLIVFFERSTWEFVYTGNEIHPFVWQQINSELGVESSHSVVPFDKIAIGIGNVGIHSCNGASVERIDSKIPDEVFNIREFDNAPERVYGIRDYFTEMVYWTFPTSLKFSNKVLTYNYKTGSWSFFDDSFTVFGYHIDNPVIPFRSTIRSRTVIAGNQQGLVVFLDRDIGSNVSSLYITDISINNSVFTVIDHNLETNNYILITNVVGTTGINDNIFKIRFIDDNTFELLDGITGTVIPLSGGYQGNGVIARISEIDIRTKEYNFYVKEGKLVNLTKVDFLVDKTESGQISLDTFVSTSTQSLTLDAQETGVSVGSNILETTPYPLITLESSQVRLWHPLYFQSEGENVQLRFFFSADQLTNKAIAQSKFELHAMVFHVMPGSDRL